MNNITKYNLKTISAASITLVLLLCLVSYISAPTSDSFIEAINPTSALSGLVFALNYLGLHVALAIVVLVILLIIVWFILLLVARNIIK